MKPQVWIFEDNKILIDLYESILSSYFKVTKMSSLSEACDYLSSQQKDPDLAIIDLGLEDGNFLSLLENSMWEKRIAEWCKIFISNVDDLMTIQSCLDQGAFDFLSKPFNKNELIAKCLHAINLTSFPKVCPLSHRLIFNNLSSETLTSNEHKLYTALLAKKEMSADQLTEFVWLENKVRPKIAVCVSRLRKKIKHLGFDIEFQKIDKIYRLKQCS